MKPVIETYSGTFLDLVTPDPASIELTDIARGLSHQCRYTGQCSRFYSVAEHAVLVASRLAAMGAPQEVQLYGLHHDDSEAFLGDVSSPLKSLLGEAYHVLEDSMMSAIAKALGLNQFLVADRRIKQADLWALAAEAYYLLPSCGHGWESDGLFDPETDHVGRMGLSPDDAAFAYLDRHEMLSR